jgi:hypothetical protein
MKIKKIRIFEEIRDVTNDRIDVGVEDETGYTYVVTVCTPKDLLEEMEQEKTNFIVPDPPMIIVKSLTEEIVEEAIQACAEENDGFWIKLQHFATDLDVSIFNSIFNQMAIDDAKEWDFDEDE